MTVSSNEEAMELQPLSDLMTICVDDEGNWHRPEYPRYREALAAPKPFLVPSFDGSAVEVLPQEKQNRRIRFEDSVHVMEIENRFQMMEPDEREDDDSYEIEIVEGSGANGVAGNEDDADFYLEMIDGEIFYVFETEDDISVEDEYDSDDSGDSSDDSSSECDTQTSGEEKAPMQLNFDDMMTPNLHESLSQIDTAGIISDDDEDDTNSETSDAAHRVELTEISSIADKSDHTGKLEATEEEATKPSSKNARGTRLADDNKVSPHIPMEIDTSRQNEMAVKNAAPLPQSPTRNDGPSSQEGMVTPPMSPERVTATFAVSPPLTPRSILKASPLSPTKAKKKTERKAKKDKKDKTFTKTFVRASDFDGEHRVYSWEKPTWTNQQLRSTGKGDELRKSGNLAQPITDAATLIEKGKVKWEKPEWATQSGEHDAPESDLDAKEELIRKIQDGSMNLPGMRNSKRRLKLSINGSVLAAGGDIVKPITKATIIKKPSNINYIANPKILRATPGGSKLWNGENLAGPVTQATSIKKYDWEKPEWVKPKLQTTCIGEKLKSGQDVAASIATKPNVEWEKPDWATKRGIGRTKSASLADVRKEYKWEKPSWAKSKLDATKEDDESTCDLRPTEKGMLARRGKRLELPITNLPHMAIGKESSHSDDGGGRPVPRRGLRRTKSEDF
jgi:hypothetical protein